MMSKWVSSLNSQMMLTTLFPALLFYLIERTNKILSNLRHEIKEHQLLVDKDLQSEIDQFGYYRCRVKCGLVFSTKTTRNRCV